MQQIAQKQTSTTDEHNLWTARTAASRAGFQSPVTVLRAWRRGELPGYKFNARSVRFAPKDVLTWMAQARAGSSRDAQ